MRLVTVLISVAILTLTTLSLYNIVTHTAFCMCVVINLLGAAYVFGYTSVQKACVYNLSWLMKN